MKATQPSNITIVSAVVIFVTVSLLKAPALFQDPRMWAEEGTLYYNAIQTLGISEALMLVVRGNYQLLTNFFVFLATQVPLTWAAHITTYLSFSVAIFTAYLIALFCVTYGVERFICFIAVATWAILPQTYEVFATATGVQWVCAVSVLLICALSPHALPERYRPLIYFWTAICGLTGVPSCVTTPGFLLRSVAERSRPHLVVGLILGACSIIQLAVIATHHIEGRAFPSDTRTLVLPGLLQTVLSPLFTADLIEVISKEIRVDIAMSSPITISVTTVSLSLMCIAATLAWSSGRRNLTATVVFLWFFVTVINTFGALGDPVELISGWVGGALLPFWSCLLCTHSCAWHSC